MGGEGALRESFDRVAALYDEARPGYPPQLVEDVITLSGIPPGGTILEIGCGSGQATLPFARRGYAMLCLELGANLAALAAAHCRPYPRVEVQNVSFEEWPLGEGSYDLVMAAQSFDWISPQIAYPKAAAALRAGGSLALFWNHSRGGEGALDRALRRARQEVVPELSGKAERALADWMREVEGQMGASGLFAAPVVRTYPWRETYTTADYVKLLRTYSAVQGLGAAQRERLLDVISAVVERHGGQVAYRYVAVLYVARVRR